MKSLLLSTILLPLLAVAIDPAKSKGTFGPFTPAKKPLASATGGPASVNAATAQKLQAACDSWTKDTGIVTNFQNNGKSTAAGQPFKDLANGAYVAEVDELDHKAILDGIIGNDPTVSIANLTLTNGVFQSVVDNLQIMSVQGKTRVNLIDYINSVRCVQILPSIDAYCAVAARVIGPTATLRKAVRPSACAAVLAANTDPANFPNVPNVPGGSPLPPNPQPSAGADKGGKGGKGGIDTDTDVDAGTGTGTGTGGGVVEKGGQPTGGNAGKTGDQQAGQTGDQTGGQTGGKKGKKTSCKKRTDKQGGGQAAHRRSRRRRTRVGYFAGDTWKPS